MLHTEDFSRVSAERAARESTSGERPVNKPADALEAVLAAFFLVALLAGAFAGIVVAGVAGWGVCR